MLFLVFQRTLPHFDAVINTSSVKKIFSAKRRFCDAGHRYRIMVIMLNEPG